MASNKVPLKGYMDGIDISAWQDTIDITKVPCDFVIVKATEGTDYKNRYFAKHCDQAMKAGKLLGAFHYANGGDPHREFGRSDRAWCKEWCDHVYSNTGVKPLIYIQKSAMDNVKGLGYRLWVAQYPDYERTGYQEHPWNEGQYECDIRQYTSVGRLPGYDGNLDLNKSYIDKTTWKKYAAKKTGSSQKKSIDVIAREVIACDWGNGDDRKNRLKKAGYDHVKVQNKVNEMLGR